MRFTTLGHTNNKHCITVFYKERTQHVSRTVRSFSQVWTDDISYALRNLEERTVASELVRLLSDASLDTYLLVRIALAMGDLEERTVASELVRLLSDASLDTYLRVRIALALGKLDEHTVASELVRLLSDASLDTYLRIWFALALGDLGERTVASELVRLLSDASFDKGVQRSIAMALEMLATDPISIHRLACLLSHPTLADTAYRNGRQITCAFYPT